MASASLTTLCPFFSWTVEGQDLLVAPMLPCFVRAPTDNDSGGSGGTAHAARWLQLGVDRLQPADVRLQVQEHGSERIVVEACLCA
jgi:Beta galactosidase small chain